MNQEIRQEQVKELAEEFQRNLLHKRVNHQIQAQEILVELKQQDKRQQEIQRKQGKNWFNLGILMCGKSAQEQSDVTFTIKMTKREYEQYLQTMKLKKAGR